MSELAFNLSGEPFEVPANAIGWRVRRMKQRGEKGAPEVVYGRDGVPVVLPIDACMEDLRRAIDAPGRMRLDPVADGMKPIEGASAAYVQVASIVDDVLPPIVSAPAPTRFAGTSDGMVEAMRMNTELAKAVIEKFPAIMQSAAVLIHAADGAGIAARPPFLLGAGNSEDSDEDENEENEAPDPSPGAGGFDLNALVAQIVPVVVAALMNGKLDLSKLGELLDWRKAAASGRATRATSASDAKSSSPTVIPPKASSRRVEATAPRNEATSSESLPPLDPAALAHFLAVRSALTLEESALAQEVARDLSPADLRKWFDELKALSVPDAVAKIRSLVGTDDAKNASPEAAS